MYIVKITNTFARETKKLAKKYRRIKKDFLPLLKKLEDGQLLGDAVSGFENKIYKLRVLSSDQKKGKSGGLRVMYYVISDENEIILLTIYAKNKQSNIKEKELRKIIHDIDL